jgi:hypothetical protein
MEDGATPPRAARWIPTFPEIQFSCNRLAPAFEWGRGAVDEVSR